MKAKFNKSEIMKSAHRIYRNSWCTMSEALKEAWRLAKSAMKEREAMKKRAASFKRSAYDEKNANMYKNVIFGKNDWRVDYGYRRF